MTIVSIVSKLKRKVTQIKENHSHKMEIEGGYTIVVDPAAWQLFDPDEFVTDYNIVKCKLSLIDEASYDKIIAYIGSPDKQLLPKLKNLKWLQISSHGFNGYDELSLYSNPDVMVTNVRGVYNKPMAQFCIAGYYLMNTYGLSKMANKDRTDTGIFKLVENTTVMIFGLGNIGSTLAVMCKQQGWRVLAVDVRKPEPLPEYVDAVYTMDEIDSVIGDVDYVVNVLPETESTKGIYDLEFFKKLKPDASFCNVGRGSAVNDGDLDRALKLGMLRGGVLLDAASAAKHRDNRILTTGHYSWKSDDNAPAFNDFFGTQLKKFISGETLEMVMKLH